MPRQGVVLVRSSSFVAPLRPVTTGHVYAGKVDVIGRCLLYSHWANIAIPVLPCTKWSYPNVVSYMVWANLLLGYYRSEKCRELDIPFSRSPFRGVGIVVPTAGHLYSAWACGDDELFRYMFAFAAYDVAGFEFPYVWDGKGLACGGRLHTYDEYRQCLLFIRYVDPSSASVIDGMLTQLLNARKSRVVIPQIDLVMGDAPMISIDECSHDEALPPIPHTCFVDMGIISGRHSHVLGGVRGPLDPTLKIALSTYGVPFFVDGSYPQMFPNFIVPSHHSVHAMSGVFDGENFDHSSNPNLVKILHHNGSDYAMLKNDVSLIGDFFDSLFS